VNKLITFKRRLEDSNKKFIYKVLPHSSRRIQVFNNCDYKKRSKRKRLYLNRDFSKLSNLSSRFKSVENLKTQDESPTSLKKYLVDTSCGLLGSCTLPGFFEFFVVGFTFEQTLKQRSAMICFDLCFSRFYGAFRDWFAKKVKTDHKSDGIKKYLTDTASNLLFYLSFYSTFLIFLNRPPLKKAIFSIATIAFMGLFSGRIYGRILDFWRKLWKTNPTLNK
jgi:tRNA splicing ligase